MPFTFSHPAIVLPFLKNKRVSATALIIGSISPDFEYFFRMRMQSEISHTFWGIFLIDFPLRLINLNYWYLTFLFAVFAIALRFYFGTELNKIGNAIVSVISPRIVALTLVGFFFRSTKTI